MKLSTRSTYGMRALVELALASGHGPMSASLIAHRQDLSVAYLEQLLHRLKQQGFVTSVRGPRGGYVLAKDPQGITLAEVVQTLDGVNGAWDDPVHRTRHRPAPGRVRVHGVARSTGRATHAPLNGTDGKETRQHAQRIAQAVLHCVYERLTQSLSAVTLRDLCEEVGAEAGDPLEHRYVFHI